jgi:hypothetical protein
MTMLLANRRWISFLVVGLFLVMAGPAGAAKKKAAKKSVPVAKGPPPANAAAITTLKGEFKWGMKLEEVSKIIEKRLAAGYETKLKESANDPTRQDRVRKMMRAEIKDITKGYVEFTGKSTGYDVSIIDQEFVHKAGESMLQAKEETSTRYLFFLNGGLYKMFIAFNKERVADKSFEEFGEIMQTQFGKARAVEVEFTRKGETRKALDYYEWRTAGDGLKLVDRSGFYGVYCLVVFNQVDEATLAEAHAKKRRGGNSQDSLVEAVLNAKGNGSDANENIIDQLTGETFRKPGEAPPADVVVPSSGPGPSAAAVNAAGRSARASDSTAAAPVKPASKTNTSGLEL